MTIHAANGSDLQFAGWTEVDLNLTDSAANNHSLTFPVLISNNEEPELPIIGYHVIVEIINLVQGTGGNMSGQSVISVLQCALPEIENTVYTVKEQDDESL